MSQKGSTFALHNIIYLGYSYVKRLARESRTLFFCSDAFYFLHLISLSSNL